MRCFPLAASGGGCVLGFRRDALLASDLLWHLRSLVATVWRYRFTMRRALLATFVFLALRFCRQLEPLEGRVREQGADGDAEGALSLNLSFPPARHCSNVR